MSYSKAAFLNPPVAVAILVLAAAVLWLAAAGQAGAGSDGSVELDPSDPTVGEGGTTDVDIVATPPSDTLAIWIIEVHYDPAVVQVPRDGNDAAECTNIEVPGGVAAAAGCDTRNDDDSDALDDTFVAFGGWIENDGGATGLDTEVILSTVTFEGVGSADECSDLEVVVDSYLDPEGGEHAPTVTSGEICVSSTPTITEDWGDLDCTAGSEPDIGDAILTARSTIGLQNPAPPAGCPNVNANVTVNGSPQKWGNVDCTNEGGLSNADIGDAILIARSTIGLANPAPPAGCHIIKDDVQVAIS